MSESTEIKFDSRNARKHGQKNKETIKASLKSCGAGRSIVLDSEGVIIGGKGGGRGGKSKGGKSKGKSKGRGRK